jgi:hypothetical protein
MAAGAVILGASIVAAAAIQAEPASEGSSSVIPAYSITFVLVIVLVCLFAYKRIRSKRANASLGALKMPAAIGARLDIARRHPDIPSALLSETFSSCSVDTLSFLDTPDLGAALSLDDAAGESADSPSDLFDLLPDWMMKQLLRPLPNWKALMSKLVARLPSNSLCIECRFQLRP